MNEFTTNPMHKNISILAEFTAKCQEDMLNNGLACDEEFILDGERHRYSADADQRKKDEWYIGTIEAIPEGQLYICTYASWSTGQRFTFKMVFTEGERMNADEIEGIKLKQERAKAFREAKELQKKRRTLRELYNEYHGGKDNPKMHLIPKHKDHDLYLRNKQIKPYENDKWPVKYYWYELEGKRYPALVIPAITIDGELSSAEYIFYVDGVCTKRFHYGLEKKGAFYPIDGIGCCYPLRGTGFCYPDGAEAAFHPGNFNHIKRLFIVEGYATGASLYESLVRMLPNEINIVIVAFDAGNIPSVVGILRKRFSSQEIIIFTDEDETGNKYADIACSLYNCKKQSIPV